MTTQTKRSSRTRTGERTRRKVRGQGGRREDKERGQGGGGEEKEDKEDDEKEKKEKEEKKKKSWIRIHETIHPDPHHWSKAKHSYLSANKNSPGKLEVKLFTIFLQQQIEDYMYRAGAGARPIYV